MSEENIKVVRRLYDAIGQGNSASVLNLYDPEIEADYSESPYGDLTGGTLIYRGHEGMRRLAQDWNDAWATVEYDLVELIDAGPHVIAAVTYRGRGRSSGVEVERTDYPVWTIRDGKVVKVVWFRRREDALEAAGLSE